MGMERGIMLAMACSILLCVAFCEALTKPVHHPGHDDEVLATIERSGGYMGSHDTSTLYRDGRIVDSAGGVRRIPARTLDALIRKMAALDSGKQCAADSTELCFDCFYYRITIHQPSGNKVIAANELQLYCDDSVSALARSLRDLAFGSLR